MEAVHASLAVVMWRTQWVKDALRTDFDRRLKLIKIGAKVVSHSRYVVFQMADVAVPRTLFGEILGRIAQLRASPELARAG